MRSDAPHPKTQAKESILTVPSELKTSTVVRLQFYERRRNAKIVLSVSGACRACALYLYLRYEIRTKKEEYEALKA